MRTRWIVAGIALAVVVVLVVIAAAASIAVLVVSQAPWNASEFSVADDGSGPATEDDDDFGTVEVYAVLDDGSLDPVANGLTLEVWETFVRVATLEFAAETLIQYRVGDAPESDTLAYVYQDSDPQYWILATNLATSDDPQQLVATLIHEYAHILTLEVDEVDPSASSCDTLAIDEGCASEDSILNAFTQTFWADYGDSAPDPANTDADAAYDFYLEHEDDFVSDYAATNVVEDVAESFMTFVLEDKPAGDSIAASKLTFFWDYPQLVEVRERIRAEFAEDLGLAR